MKEKTFIIPEAIIVDFSYEDIITLSNLGDEVDDSVPGN